MTSRISEEARALLSAAAVRVRANELFALAETGKLEHWTLNLDTLPACADFVAALVRKRYPTLDVPFHARWRHFVFNGRDLWAETATSASWRDVDARARAEFDLAVVSVLLDAGAGPGWIYSDAASGIVATHSEGLALASLRLFEWGGFSADPADPLRVDAVALARLDGAALGDAFQVTLKNPLAGLDGRIDLLHRLAAQMISRPDAFGRDEPTPGALFDALAHAAGGQALKASRILDVLLDTLGPIWKDRPTLDGVALGDCWPLAGAGCVPLHKLSQWLAYSLIEPLERAGVRVTEVDGLTGLAEYRNGGLFIDMGVIVPRDAAVLSHAHNVADALVVSWRSLTVALLDRIAPLVRDRLGVTAAEFPLARVLEGGTWAAGRAIAREMRTDGSPPLLIHSDGTVF